MNDVLIAGGGLAGAAAAAQLARAGASVTLIERESAPHNKICGEFLSVEAQASLASLGLDIAPLGGRPITNMRLIRGARTVTAKLPFTGIGLSRKILDEALLSHAAAQGAKLVRGHAIRNIEGNTLNIAGLGELRGRNIFLATGKHQLRGSPRDFAPPNLVGFKMYFTLAPRQQAELSHHVELIMLKHGYAGLQLVEHDQANLCLLINTATLKRAGGNWDSLLDMLCAQSPRLAARLAGAAALLETPLTIARVPYGFIYAGARPGEQDPPNLFRLGDQAAVIPSFTGDGMAIALHSAALAASTYLAGAPSQRYHRALANSAGANIRRAMRIYHASNNPLLQAALFPLAAQFPALLTRAAAMTRTNTGRASAAPAGNLLPI
jgi:flavin-dependent dehydrogenase